MDKFKKMLSPILIFLFILTVIPMDEVFAQRTIKDNEYGKTNIDKSLNNLEIGSNSDINFDNKTLYTVKHIEYKTGKILEKDEDIDGFVNEEIIINEDFVNVFKGYRYKKIKTVDGEIFKDKASLVLSNDSGKNKIYIVYEKIEDVIESPGKPIAPGDSGKESPEEVEIVVMDDIFNTKDHIGYLEGYGDKTVRPESNISREEVAAAIYRLLDLDYRKTIDIKEHSFIDVSKDRWSNKYIKTLVSDSILLGYRDGKFRPSDSISRGELAVLMSRFDKLEKDENIRFVDIYNHWAEKEIISCASKGWIKGYEDRSFRPDEKITRAEFVTLFNRILGRKSNIDYYLPEGIKGFVDLNKEKWYYLDMLEAINDYI